MSKLTKAITCAVFAPLLLCAAGAFGQTANSGTSIYGALNVYGDLTMRAWLAPTGVVEIGRAHV